MAQTILVPTTVLNDDQALNWLMRETRHDTSVSELARQWGWNRMRVLRRLRRWSDQGLLTRQITDDGRSTIVINLNKTVNNTVNITVHPPVGPLLASLNIASIAATLMLGLALAVAWYGVQINAWYGTSLGRDAGSAALLSGLSIVSDLVALLLPAVGRGLRDAGYRREAAVAWALWSLTMGVALMATIGFASVNIADATAARAKIADQSAALTSEIARLEAERGGVNETRSVAEIETELQAAQPAAAAVWSATGACHDVTRAHSAELCAPIQRLREAQGTAARRDALDQKLTEHRIKLAALPAVTTADPQAEMAAHLLRWLSGGWVAAGAPDIQMARIAGMTLLPQIAGLVLMLATALWRLGKDKGRSHGTLS